MHSMLSKPKFYITLVRGIPGTRRLHRRTLEALRLRKCNRTVMRWNTPTVRGMLQQVKRLVVIETEEMYKARKQNDVNHRAVRPPLVINHLPASASSSQSELLLYVILRRSAFCFLNGHLFVKITVFSFSAVFIEGWLIQLTGIALFPSRHAGVSGLYISFLGY